MRCSGGGGWRGWENAVLPQRKAAQRAKGKARSATRPMRRRTPLGTLLLPLCRLLIINNNSNNPITTRNPIDNIHAANDLSKHCVAAVEMWLRRMRHEPLRAARIFARQRHAYRRA